MNYPLQAPILPSLVLRPSGKGLKVWYAWHRIDMTVNTTNIGREGQVAQQGMNIALSVSFSA